MAKYKTLFCSDIHLGTRGCQAVKFLDFIKNNEFEKIYIVGDFIDFWALKRKKINKWSQAHNDVIQKLLRKHRKGTEINYITGNHDDIKQFWGEDFGGIKIKPQDEHETIDGKKILVIHGHQLDVAIKYAPWLENIGNYGYDFLIWLNFKLSWLFKLTNWSLSQFVKSKVKSAVSFIGNFEKRLSHLAKTKGFDAVLAGHIHHPEMRYIDEILYLNTGDWVETVSCIVEEENGDLLLLKENNNGLMKLEKRLHQNLIIDELNNN